MSSDPSLSFAEYKLQRESIINHDKSLRREFLPSNLKLRSDKEFEADKIVRQIRASEAETIWKEDHPSVTHPFPGMEFLTGKRIIEKTKLFDILSKMPKGALLHAHLDATVNAEFLLQLALKYPAIHIRLLRPLDASNLFTNPPEFRPLPKEEFSSIPSLTDPSYELANWVSLTSARESFSPTLGGKEGFDKWVIGSMMINPTEAYVTHNTVEKIWKKFTSTFITSTGLIRYLPIFEEYIREFFRSSIADGILYVEPRINFLYKFMYGADGQFNVPHRELLLMFDRLLKEVKEEMAQQGRAGEFIGARIIYSTIRFITPEELEWYFDDCIALKKEFPHLIAGFDLVGDENVLKPLIYYAESLLRFREKQKEAGVDIPFIFHAGETLGDGTKADNNLYDAILLGTKRIGHGFSLIKHPKLIETCRQKQIAVEVCPISNEILRLTSSMLMHPLPALMNNGVPVALSSDDPSVFGNMGLTYDYFQVLAASEVTGLSTLGALARDSIEFSTLDKDDKERAMAVFEKQWGEFSGEFVGKVQLCSVPPSSEFCSADNETRKRSRSPSDSEQPKNYKRANTGGTALDAANTAAAHDTNSSTPNSSVKKEDHDDYKNGIDSNNSSVKKEEQGDHKNGTLDNGKDSATTSGEPSSSTSAAPPPPAGNIHMRCLIVTQDASIIIGKGGSHVNEIREKSGARVMVSESIPGNPERILNVSGPLDAVSKAFGLIVRRINDEPFDVPSVPGSRAVTIKFMIPNSRMGSVIGKAGSKIKEIQEASGARLNASEGMLPGSTERVLSVAGVADAIHIATYYIGNILLEAQERMPSHNTGTSYRPGNQRASTRPMQGGGGGHSSGGGSSYVPGGGSNYPGGGGGGNSYAPHNPPQQLQTQQIYIPNDLVGCIIGKGGSKINEIRHMSASQIKIMEPGSVGTDSNGAPQGGGENERLVVITGQTANINMAVQLLYHRLEQEKQKQIRANASPSL